CACFILSFFSFRDFFFLPCCALFVISTLSLLDALPIFNTAYREMAAHYSAAVLPARIRAPKDKPSTENTVGHVATWVIAALRKRSEEHTSELQSRFDLVCRLLLEKKKSKIKNTEHESDS